MEISSDALRRLRREIGGESDGVVDEIGVGGIHTGYADHFFPGTSVLQKRPRYLFFTCWNYLCLDAIDSSLPVVERKERAEAWVRDSLKRSHQSNIIGARVDRPAQPVDFIYWTALKTWGLYRGVGRSRLMSNWTAMRPRRVGTAFVENEETISELPAAAFFVKEPPRSWLRPKRREELTFDLERDEAEFLQKRLESLPACVLSEAASMAHRDAPAGRHIWDDGLIREAAKRQREVPMLDRSKLASSMAHIVRAVYAALVERRRNETAPRSQMADVDDRVHYEEILRDAVTQGREKALALDIDAFQRDLPRLGNQLLLVLRHVRERISSNGTPSSVLRSLLDDDTMDLFCATEVRRKGVRRARLPNTANGQVRRATFDEKTLTIGGIDYRWQTVRMLLADLHNGLKR
jgi:hypothetical protein